MRCPKCGGPADLVGPSYFDWQPVLYRCSHGHAFSSQSGEAIAESDALRERSRSNAAARRAALLARGDGGGER